MNLLRWRFFLAFAVVTVVVYPGNAAPNTIRVLTIGNSFAGNAKKYLGKIAEADPEIRLEIGGADIGGSSLEKHWKLSASGEKPYGGKMKISLVEALKSKPWDVVTLQQFSAAAVDYTTYQPYLDNLAKLVREHAPQAKLFMHQTWAYRPDHPFLAEGKMTQAEMFSRIEKAYAQAAQAIDGGVLPVGAAFQKARDTEVYRRAYPIKGFTAENYQHPDLPDQSDSVVVGYYWRKVKDKWKLGGDFKHANDRGCYLAGAVWFEAITGRDVRENLFRPPTLQVADWQKLKAIAHETVTGTK